MANEYLEEQKKQQSAPAAPQAAPTTVQAVDGYGKFLETLANNKRIENTPTNAKTYADYLTYIGQDPIGDYNAKVRQANLDYAKGLATFGQAAEKMAKSGMTGSGYGEYLQGIAYQGKQSAVGAAQQAAQAAMKQTFSSYGEYLEGVKGTNEQNAINGIVSGLLEGDAAKAYARQQGVTEDRLEQVLAQTSGTVSAAKQQKLADATSAVTSLMGNGQTIDAAISSLKGVYDQTVLDQVKANLQKANAQQAGATIGTATGVTDFKAGLDQQLGRGDISLTDHTMQLEEGSAKNLALINALVNDGDISGLSAYIDTLAEKDKDGNVKKGKSGAEVWAKMDDKEKAKQIEEWVDELHASGNLTTLDYNKFYFDDMEKSLREDTDNAKELLNWSENLGTRLANGQISQKQYNSLISAYSAKAGVIGGAVFVDEKSYNGGQDCTINYKQGEFGSEAIIIRWGELPEVTGSGFVAGKKVSLKGGISGGYGDSSITFGTINGRVAYKVGNKYYQAKSGTPEYLNNEQNAAFIAYMMVP